MPFHRSVPCTSLIVLSGRGCSSLFAGPNSLKECIDEYLCAAQDRITIVGAIQHVAEREVLGKCDDPAKEMKETLKRALSAIEANGIVLKNVRKKAGSLLRKFETTFKRSDVLTELNIAIGKINNLRKKRCRDNAAEGDIYDVQSGMIADWAERRTKMMKGNEVGSNVCTSTNIVCLDDEEKEAAQLCSSVTTTSVVCSEKVLNEIAATNTANTPVHQSVIDTDTNSEEWILTCSKRRVRDILHQYVSGLPKSEVHAHLAYFGIVDLTGEDQQIVATIFDAIETNVRLDDDDIVSALERISFEEKRKNEWRRLVQHYVGNLASVKPNTHLSEASFLRKFLASFVANLVEHDGGDHIFEEGEVQSLASAIVANWGKKVNDRSLPGQKVDFRIRTNAGFEGFCALRSGGLPETNNIKKVTSDKVDLGVLLRDILLQEGMAHSGLEPKSFRKMFVIGWLSHGFTIQTYAVDWMAPNLWRLGRLVAPTSLPRCKEQLLMLAELLVLSLRVLKTLRYANLQRIQLDVQKSRRHRREAMNAEVPPFATCHTKITRQRKKREAA
ncbi:hypothetical protein BC832DRAFT_623564 [Gaertneriomyces semiglobifer]|nr:hypothetical protein BC832DRAFT_623564 [Gaertneriomyces semiglobifer]